jgi:hypothetical protein
MLCLPLPAAAGESMHMAKAAEGRNAEQDRDPIDAALHDALKPDRRAQLGGCGEQAGCY